MTRIRVARTWDEAAYQTLRYAPPGIARVLLDWDLPSPDSDTALPAGLDLVLAHALLRHGCLTFPWFGPPDWAAGEARLHRPRGLLPHLPRLARMVLADIGLHAPAAFVTTAHAAVAARLFDGSWFLGQQIALVYDPAAAVDDPALARLVRLGDWRATPLAAPVRALFAAGVDGDVAVLAAEAARLDLILADLASLASQAGMEVIDQR